MHQDVLCTSRDCPIFYRRVKHAGLVCTKLTELLCLRRRKKVQKDLVEAEATLERFAW